MTFSIEEIMDLAQTKAGEYREFENTENALHKVEQLLTAQYGEDACAELNLPINILMGECETQGFYNGYVTAIQLMFHIQPPKRRNYR